MSYLTLNQVWFSYEDDKNQTSIVKNLNLEIKKGEFLVVLGPSGCGKSTLLSLLAGLKIPTSGTITMEGKKVEGPSLKNSVIFQQDSLFPWMTVEKNVRFGLRQAKPGMEKEEERRVITEALLQVGMEKERKKYPFQLSGGMQQRTAIARTLAMDSEILLMDEPFGAIDPQRRGVLQDLLADICQRGKTIVFVTHHMDEAILLGDRILYFNEDGSYEEIQVDLKRPRKADKLAGSQCFCSFRKRLMECYARGKEESL